MEISWKEPQTKIISFEDYEKYFMPALVNPDPLHFKILFYKKAEKGLLISFSWDNFIIITEVSYDAIVQLYKDTNLEISDVTLSDREDHPMLLKFYSDYLFNRGIPEK